MKAMEEKLMGAQEIFRNNKHPSTGRTDYNHFGTE